MALALTDYSDVMLAAEIVLEERRLDFDYAPGDCPDTDRYRDLVAERHARTLARGRALQARFDAAQKMLEELALLAPGGALRESGCSFEVDDVVRDDEGLIVAIYGTKTSTWLTDKHEPYILGPVS
jgi:hypothetical protein